MKTVLRSDFKASVEDVIGRHWKAVWKSPAQMSAIVDMHSLAWEQAALDGDYNNACLAEASVPDGRRERWLPLDLHEDDMVRQTIQAGSDLQTGREHRAGDPAVPAAWLFPVDPMLTLPFLLTGVAKRPAAALVEGFDYEV